MTGANVLRMDLTQRNGHAAFIARGRLKGWTPGDINALRKFIKLPTQARAKGLGQTPDLIINPTFTPYTPPAPAALDYSTFTMPTPTDVFQPSFIPQSGGGSYIPSTSVLYPLTIAPPAASASSAAQTVAALIAGGSGTIGSLIQGGGAAPTQTTASSGVSSWLAAPSGLGVSNQVLLAGGLGLVAVVMLARRK